MQSGCERISPSRGTSSTEGALIVKHSTARILTTQCGSLARPKDLLDLMKAKLNGEAYDQLRYANYIAVAVAQTVREQAESDIDVVEA